MSSCERVDVEAAPAVVRKPETWSWTRIIKLRVPTWQGWVAFVMTAVAASVVTLFSIHPFLAVTEPVGGGFLIVEGWLHDDAVPDVIGHFNDGGYHRILTTGGPMSRGSLLADYGTYAEYAAASLIKAGAPAERVHPIPALPVDRDRTHASAVAVREWIEDRGFVIERVDLVSKGLHARRSRLLYQMTLGPEVEVGIIALPATDYDADAWWRYSAGVRTVVGETLAYLYVKFVF